MENVIKELTIKDYVTNISAELENIGTCADELLSSKEAQENNKLFRNLTIILSSTFKTYISTSNLELYLTDPTINIESEKYYSNFKAYKTGAFIIVSFTTKLYNFDVFTNTDSKEYYLFRWLTDSINRFNNDINALSDYFYNMNEGVL